MPREMRKQPPDGVRSRLSVIVSEMEMLLGSNVKLTELQWWTTYSYCTMVIHRTKGNKVEAARILGVPRARLSRIMSRVGR